MACPSEIFSLFCGGGRDAAGEAAVWSNMEYAGMAAGKYRRVNSIFAQRKLFKLNSVGAVNLFDFFVRRCFDGIFLGPPQENDNQIVDIFCTGANDDLAMNAVSSLVGEREAMAIRSKSLNYNYLTISDSTSSLLKVLMIGVFPLVYLGIGICVVIRRRRMQHETV